MTPSWKRSVEQLDNRIVRLEQLLGLIGSVASSGRPIIHHVCGDDCSTPGAGREYTDEEKIEQLSAALIKLDRAAERAIKAIVAKGELTIHELDDVRGTIWATSDAASDVLKEAAKPDHPYVWTYKSR